MFSNTLKTWRKKTNFARTNTVVFFEYATKPNTVFFPTKKLFKEDTKYQKIFKKQKTPEIQTTKNLAHCSQSFNLFPALKCHRWTLRIYLWLLCQILDSWLNYSLRITQQTAVSVHQHYIGTTLPFRQLL